MKKRVGKTSRRIDEFRLTCAVAEYLSILESQRKLTYCHIPNEGRRDPKSGALLKRMGMRAGMPDFIIWTGTATSRDHFMIELKCGGGRLTPNQTEMHKRIERHGFTVYVANSFGEVQAIVESRIA